MSRLKPRLPSLDGTVIGFGHRGAMAEAAPNTIPSFRRAVELGATGIESDVWLTADGVAVLDHDGVIGSRLRRRPIRHVDRADLPDHIPSLDDLYREIGPDLALSLDVKDPDALPAVLDSARRHGPDAERRLFLCAEGADGLAHIRRWRPLTSARLILSTRLKDHPDGLERLASDLEGSEADGLNLRHPEWSGGHITLVHRFGLLALAWGTIHRREVAQLIDIGIDAVYNDHVDRMMDAIGQFDLTAGR